MPSSNALAKPDIVLGIDLGSSRSAVAYYDPTTKTVHTVGTSTGSQKVYQSLVAFDEEGRIVTCDEAKSKILSSECTVFSNLKKALVDNMKYQYNGVIHKPIYFLAQILKRLKKEAQKEIGYAVEKAVVTVPAYFEQVHKASIRKAASLAGLQVLKLINEPTAAIIAYSHSHEGALSMTRHSEKLQKESVLILDAGGFTFDGSLCTVDNDVIDVLSTHGDYNAGHHLITEAIKGDILAHFTRHLGSSSPVKISEVQDRVLTQLSEKLKIALSDSEDKSISVTIKLNNTQFEYTLTRDKLIDFYTPYIRKVQRVISTLLNKSPGKLTRAFLIGGPANSRLTAQWIEQMLPLKLNPGLDPVLSVARGAAIHGYRLTEGKGQGQVLLDVIPISLGVEQMGRYCHKMLLRNSKIPCSHKEVFSTYEDYQKRVKIKILQGQDIMSENCLQLGTITLDEIEPARKGVPKLIVHFQVNSSGLLTVIAEDEKTNARKNLTLQCENRISDSEAELMSAYMNKREKEDLTHSMHMRIMKDAEQCYVTLSELALQIHNHPSGLIHFENDIKTALERIHTEILRYPKNYTTLLELTRTAKVLTAEFNDAIPRSSSEYLA